MSLAWSLLASDLPPEAAGAFGQLDKVFGLDGQAVSHGRLCHVVRVRMDGNTYYVKRYLASGKGLRRFLGRSRLHREWINLQFFKELGIPVPRVVAVGQQHAGLTRRGALITEEVSGALDLGSLRQEHPELFRHRSWLDQVSRRLADYLGRLHRRRFTYHDLKWRNVLVTRPAEPAVYLIDCPAGRRHGGHFLRHGIIKDLASLDKSARQHLPRTVRLRFFLHYRGVTRLRDQDKDLVRRVLRFRFKGEKRKAKTGRAGRPPL